MGPLGRKHLNGVLLDLDGTLLDSDPDQAAAGRQGAGALASTASPWAAGDPDSLMAEVLGRLAGADATPEAVRKAPGLIRAWHARGVPIALVTSATRVWAEFAVEEVLGVRECLTALISREDVARGKPDAAPYAAGCRALHIPPGEATAVQDSIAAVSGAVAAAVGMVVGVAAIADAESLRAAGAHRVVPSLDVLAPH